MRSDPDPLTALSDERARLEAAHAGGEGGRALVRRLSDAMDAAVRALWAAADPGDGGIAVVALGGYGRGELSPHSDVDLMVLHDGHKGIRAVAESMFYRLWDAGLQVGHATRTLKECKAIAAADLQAETSFLDARLIAGDERLFERFAAEALKRTRKRGVAFVRDCAEAARARAREHGHASFLLEPNLKEGAGGLRDLHTIGWLRTAFPAEADAAGAPPADAAELLHRVRNELHVRTGTRTDVLLVEHQADVARALGYHDDDDAMAVDVLLRDFYLAARTIEHAASSALAETEAALGGRGRAKRLAEGLTLDAGRIVADPEWLATRPHAPVAVFAEAARAGAPVAADTLRAVRERIAAGAAWDDDVARAFFDLLGTGDAGALEAFDHAGALTAYLPEWAHVRCRPQHNIYHRYTVDVHGFATVAGLVALGNAAPAADAAGEAARRAWESVDDRALLLLAGLLHDAGKGLPGDHSVEGERIARSVGERIGLDAGRTATLSWLVRNHLLLVDTATRRDLGDENLVVDAATVAGDPQRLHMLYALTVADGLGTGPDAWGSWKAALVHELYVKAMHVLERGDLTSRDAVDVARLRAAELTEALSRFPADAVAAHLDGMSRAYLLAFPTTVLIRHFALMDGALEAGEARTHVAPAGEPGIDELTVVARDRPGLFSKVSGALALGGVRVLSAQAFTRRDGVALEIFRVTGAFEPQVPSGRWERVLAGIEQALRGRIALDARIDEKRAAYERRTPKGRREPPSVTIDNGASDFATVVEVHAPDRIGLLYAITRALADLELDIVVAKIATYGEDVTDAFYVRDLDGQKITDPAHIAEIERTILHSVGAGGA